MPTQYLLLKELYSGRPTLGDGFDPLVRFVSPRKACAVSFTATSEPASTQYADIFEVNSTLDNSSSLTLTASGKYSTYVSGRYSGGDEATFFAQNTVFSVRIVAIVRRVVATSIALTPGLDQIGADNFRATYGAQIVKVMHYGGYISLLFRFSKLDFTTKEKVTAALNFWQGAADVSIESAMTSHGVQTQYEIKADQEGGQVPLFLGTSLDALRTHLAAWYPTLMDHAQPILMEVIDYKNAMPNFPYNFRSWLEPPTPEVVRLDVASIFPAFPQEGGRKSVFLKPHGDHYLLLDGRGADGRVTVRLPKSAVTVEKRHHPEEPDSAPDFTRCDILCEDTSEVEVITRTTFANVPALSQAINSYLVTGFEVSPTAVRMERRSERYQVYAAPAPLWGPWSVVGSHIGRASFRIAVEPMGDTVVRGEVKYYDEVNNTLVEQPFYQEVAIRTGDSVANVEVRLQGVPSGSSCWVTVS